MPTKSASYEWCQGLLPSWLAAGPTASLASNDWVAEHSETHPGETLL
jgi:hypothetical protein